MSQKILLLDSNHPLLKELLEQNGFGCDEDYTSTKEELMKKMDNYEGLVIRSRFKIDATFMDAASKLKCIARAGAGMENIDVVYAEQKGIKCVHAPEGNRDAVGEQAIGMLLALMNNLMRSDKEVRTGIWLREENRGYELNGKTVGIIGFGNMGSAFAERLHGFGVKILAYDKYKTNFGNEFVKEASLQEIFDQADVLSLHIPLTDETRFWVNDDFISSFKKNIWLINTARGKILQTEALVKHLKTGKVIGACLDVLEYETVSFEQLDASKLPVDFQYLIQSDKVILSPHIAGWTFESHEKIAKVLAKKIIATLA
jgi:D-3-phosphoglycerate dehydrogenase / 2-oxoglutarate reductase